MHENVKAMHCEGVATHSHIHNAHTRGVTWRNVAGSGDISFIKTIAHHRYAHSAMMHAVCLMLHNANDEEEVTVLGRSDMRPDGHLCACATDCERS